MSRSSSPRHLAWLVAALLAAACGPQASNSAAPEAPDARLGNTTGEPSLPRQEPPPPGTSREATFPAMSDQLLANGLKLRVVERHRLPIVDLRLVVFSGSATDGAHPGVAQVTGELLKDGGAGPWTSRQLLERAEALGATLDIATSLDATTISLGVAKEHLGAALEIIGTLVQKPRLAPLEFTKLVERERERVASLARADGSWAASMVLYRELFAVPTGAHPYARYDVTPSELAELRVTQCRQWHERHFVPANAALVLAGDVTPEEARSAVDSTFAQWQGATPQTIAYPRPLNADRLTVKLIDRAGSAQADIRIGLLAVERRSPQWAALKAANQILGGGVAGRLFLDVREKRSLAYRTGSVLRELAHGPVPEVLVAGTRTEKAPLTVGALLDHLDRIGAAPPEPDEAAIASRYLADSMLIDFETVGSLSALSSRLFVLGLPPTYYDSYRTALRTLDVAEVFAAVDGRFDRARATVVVAGDADRLAQPLSRFGPVRVIDAEGGFKVKRTLAHDPTAALDVPEAPAATAP